LGSPIDSSTPPELTSVGDPTALSRPNIVLILLDDAGTGDLGAYGNQDVATPAIDRFARESMLFTQAYASAPVCSPTRAAFLTGRYPARYGIRRVISGRGLPSGSATLLRILREAGYTTAHIGKWQLGLSSREFLPRGQGFHRSALFKSPLALSDEGYRNPTITIDDSTPVKLDGHLTEILTDYAVQFLEEDHAGPFFLNLWYRSPHAPAEPAESWAKRYPSTREGRHRALVAQTDTQIGRLLDALNRLDLAAYTLVILTSDNGAARRKRTGNGPLRGYKSQVFEGGIRVPLIARWPGSIPANTRNHSVVVSMDLVPTVATLLGFDVAALRLDGNSFLDALRRNTHLDRQSAIFWENKERNKVTSVPSNNLNTFAVRSGNWKLVHERRRTQLFDLGVDPEEMSNLAAANREVVRELLAEYRNWRVTIPRIEYEIESVTGSVDPAPDTFVFHGPGRVVLESNVLFDFHDGDFTFRFKLALQQPQQHSTAERVIAWKRGSWKLLLTPHRHLKLVVHGSDGTKTTLRSQTGLVPTRTYDVAFTVFGFRSGNSLIRLYVDHAVEATTLEIGSVRVTDASIELGAVDGSAQPFRGALRELSLYSACLSAEELAMPMPPGHKVNGGQ
jgi:arylsulfatase A-like enzyme